MSKLVIEGGVPLKGTIQTSGAKNAALPILAGAILLEGESEITNVPHLQDVVSMVRMLNSLGIRTEYHMPQTVKIWNNRKIRHIAPYELVTAMRASFFVAGPILARTGLAKVPLPGGCSIGTRPIDLHLKAFEALGATVSIEHGFVQIKAKSLVGARHYLDFPSVGATENMMMAASLAKGETYIGNAAKEPEIVDLGEFLIKAGAKITGLGTSTIKVEGVDQLKGVKHPVIPDRVEAATLLIAAAITKGDVLVKDAIIEHLEAMIQKLRNCGVGISVEGRNIRATYKEPLKGIDFETLPFPGFPTDMQAQMMALLTVTNGNSIIKETIFENRFMHAQELMRMGANIKLDGSQAFISGVGGLSGAEVKITDLRAGAALILAGLVANGKTTVYGLKHLKRGYENLPQKLNSLGARITE